MAQSYMDEQLLFPSNPTVLESIKEVKNLRHIPQTKGAYTAGKEVVIEWTHSQLMDAKNSFVAFEATTDASGANINNAMDFFEKIKFEINSTLVDEINQKANDINNAILAYSANDSYCEREANALYGFVSPHLRRTGANNTSAFTATWLSATARRFVVPLPLLLGAFRAGNYLPVMNQRYRLTLTFASDLKVLSNRSDTSSTYSVDNLYLHERVVHLTPAYWTAIWNSMNSDQGIRIAYTGLEPQVFSCNGGGSTERHRIQHNYSNLCSLLVMRDDLASKTASADKHTAYCQSYPFTELSKFQVKINGVNVFVDNGLEGFAENFTEAKKVFTPLNDLQGAGIIDYKAYSSGYTQNDDLTAGTYGMCVLGCDFEKVVANDDIPLNSGVSAENGNQVELELQLSTPLVSGDDELIVAMVHKKSMVMKRGAIVINK